MLSYIDCVGLSHLTDKEVEAIAEHEHLPYVSALELGENLVSRQVGCRMIERMMLDDVEHARNHGDMRHATELLETLRHFQEEHADAFNPAGAG